MTKVFEPHEIYKNLSLEDMPGEVWKDIGELHGFEFGYYMVSNMGRVKVLDRVTATKSRAKFIRKQKIMSLHLNIRPSGLESYLMFKYVVSGFKKSLIVHKVVAKLFVDNPENLNVVDHINNLKTDNRSCNLQWTTILENTRKAVRDGLWNCPGGEKSASSILKEKQVFEIIDLVKSTSLSYEKIGSIYSVSYGAVNDIVRGRTWGKITGLDKSPLSRTASWVNNFKWCNSGEANTE